MIKVLKRTIFFLLWLLMGTAGQADDGTGVDAVRIREDAPKIFLDGRDIDQNFIKTEIPFVNYVRERKEADVHLLITSQKTGSGGKEYTMSFIGQNGCEKMQNVLKYFSNSTDTKNEVRGGMVQTIKMGLAPYIASSSIASSFSMRFRDKINYQNDFSDKWNHWVFNTSVRTQLDGQKTSTSNTFDGSLEAERVTLNSRIRLTMYGRYRKNVYQLEDDDGEYNYISISDNAEFSGLWVKSLSDHWSIGGWISAKTSSYSNIDYSLQPQPAIEYNIFPYSESTRRQLRILYRAGYEKNRYREMTVYAKMKEQLLSETLSATLELTEQWGTARISVTGSHYFHDLSKNRFSVNCDLNLRIFRGFTFDINGRYSATHNQLYLAAGDYSTEDLLLRRKEMASDYSYRISVGFGYRFGSLFNNVVNPRFGASSDRRYRY